MNWPPAQLEGIDADAGLRNVGGDQAFYIKLLERFWRTQEGSGEALAAHAQLGQWSAAGARAHALRGSAAGIGAEALRAAAEALEMAVGPEGRPAGAEMAALCASLATVLASLDSYFSTHLDSHQSLLADMSRAAAAKAQLDLMLSEFSGEAGEFFDACKGDLAAALPPAAIVQLEGHMQRYEYDAARAVLALYLHNSS